MLLWILGSLVFVFRSSENYASRGRAIVDQNDQRPKTISEPKFSRLSDTLHDETGSDTKEIQLQAARDLIVRALGKDASEMFDAELQFPLKSSKEKFEIHDGVNGRILLRGTSGVALASALNWYLRYICKVDTSWYSHFPLTLPSPLPSVGSPIHRDSLVQWSYYENGPKNKEELRPRHGEWRIFRLLHPTKASII